MFEELKALPSFKSAMTKAFDFGETKAKEYGKKHQAQHAKGVRGTDRDWSQKPGYYTWQANTTWSAWDAKAEEAAPWHQHHKGDVDKEWAGRGWRDPGKWVEKKEGNRGWEANQAKPEKGRPSEKEKEKEQRSSASGSKESASGSKDAPKIKATSDSLRVTEADEEVDDHPMNMVVGRSALVNQRIKLVQKMVEKIKGNDAFVESPEHVPS